MVAHTATTNSDAAATKALRSWGPCSPVTGLGRDLGAQRVCSLDDDARLAALCHLHEEFLVVPRSAELLQQEDDRLVGRHVAEEVAEQEDAVDLLLCEE